MKKVISLSGGLDSSTLLYYLIDKYGKENVLPVTFFYNQKNDIEVDKAQIICDHLSLKLNIIDISFLGKFLKNSCSLAKNSDIDTPAIKEVLGEPQPSTYVGYRNLIMLSICLSFCEANSGDEVYISVQSHDVFNYWDTSKEFIDSVNNVSMLNRKNNIKIVAPFIDISKAEEIKIGTKLGLDYGMTWTCYDPVDEKACGKCCGCSDRIHHFAKAGIEDPINYRIDIPWSDLISKFSGKL